MTPLSNINLVLISYLILVWVFLVIEWINLGIGLGGIVFFYGMPVVILILGIALCIAYWKRPHKTLQVILLIINLACCLAMTYWFTIGRGPEKVWDGQIFYF